MNNCNWIPDFVPAEPPTWASDDARELAAEAQREAFAEEYSRTGQIKINGLTLTTADVALAAAENGTGLKEGLDSVLDDAMEMALTDLGWN